MSAHTRGPWRYDEVWSLVTGPEGPEQQICAIHGSESVPRSEAKANARLIAAAPDLLAACKEQLASYDGVNLARLSKTERGHYEHLLAAIEKAENR